jgi:hypothetical protein
MNLAKQQKREKQANDLRVANAGALHNVALAIADIEKLLTVNFAGSAVILKIDSISANKPDLVRPVEVIDGLSKETIEAIKKDLIRSYKLKTTLAYNFIPANVRKEMEA